MVRSVTSQPPVKQQFGGDALWAPTLRGRNGPNDKRLLPSCQGDVERLRSPISRNRPKVGRC